MINNNNNNNNNNNDDDDDDDDDNNNNNTLTITEVETPQIMLFQQNHLQLWGKQKEIQMGKKNVLQLYKHCIINVSMSHLMI